MPDSKWSPTLRKTADGADPGESLQVVLELKGAPVAAHAPNVSRAEQIQSHKSSFALQAKPLKDKIAKLGGEVLDEAWLNCTISARIPRKALEELSRDEQVESIDMPRAIERE